MSGLPGTGIVYVFPIESTLPPFISECVTVCGGKKERWSLSPPLRYFCPSSLNFLPHPKLTTPLMFSFLFNGIVVFPVGQGGAEECPSSLSKAWGFYLINLSSARLFSPFSCHCTSPSTILSCLLCSFSTRHFASSLASLEFDFHLSEPQSEHAVPAEIPAAASYCPWMTLSAHRACHG